MGGSESSHQRCLGKEFGELLEDYGEDDESQRSDLGDDELQALFGGGSLGAEERARAVAVGLFLGNYTLRGADGSRQNHNSPYIRYFMLPYRDIRHISSLNWNDPIYLYSTLAAVSSLHSIRRSRRSILRKTTPKPKQHWQVWRRNAMASSSRSALGWKQQEKGRREFSAEHSWKDGKSGWGPKGRNGRNGGYQSLHLEIYPSYPSGVMHQCHDFRNYS